MLVRCPSCRNTFVTERTGIQDCPTCKQPLAVPEPADVVPPPATPSGEGGAAPPEMRPGTPWERRQQIGAVRAWRDTVAEALFEPAKLFGDARSDRGSSQAAFAVLTISVFSIVGQMFNRFLLGPWRERGLERLRQKGMMSPLLEKLFAASTGHSAGTVVLVVLLTPVLAFLFIYLNAAVTHAFAALLGQNKRGFGATFAACAYASAPLVFMVIPGCGETIAVLWAIVLTGIGLKHTHRIGSGGATATVLAPYFLACCGICALSALVARVGMSQ
ncbi:MAG TPA: Yip1 family protein [Myxococcales bacterium]|nr:Yip1 family protein [Myxococcales bacterium]